MSEQRESTGKFRVVEGDTGPPPLAEADEVHRTLSALEWLGRWKIAMLSIAGGFALLVWQIRGWADGLATRQEVVEHEETLRKEIAPAIAQVKENTARVQELRERFDRFGEGVDTLREGQAEMKGILQEMARREGIVVKKEGKR